ncbi:MAG TPA: hypothetical protein VLG37_01070 [Candidatus Saccharimonadales bacterium]|nr:hypothetical protein [Candidatus Saccharimonadales bacterium]
MTSERDISFDLDPQPGRLLTPREARQQVRAYAVQAGINPEICEGFSYYLVDKFGVDNSRTLEVGTRLMEAVAQLVDNTTIYKARSFNYLPTSDDLPEVASQAFRNAQFMVDVFGVPMFAAHPNIAGQPGGVYKAPLGDDGLYLSCKGGSGSGTFSLDFAIGAYRERPYDYGVGIHNTRGEIWRMGVDTMLDPSGQRILRIIRTGSGIGINPDADSVKEEQFKAYRREYGLLPQRALAFLALYIAYDLGMDSAAALSTEGAIEISTLGRSKGICDYNGIFNGVGFGASSNPNWLGVDNLQATFYDRLINDQAESGLRLQEVRGIDELIAVFNELTTMQGEPFPVKLCQDNERHANELAVAAFSRLYRARRSG